MRIIFVDNFSVAALSINCDFYIYLESQMVFILIFLFLIEIKFFMYLD